jgi:ABC-type lipoprotein release transport system permease subunit
VAIVLLAAAMLASYIPARRASSVDLMESLRSE